MLETDAARKTPMYMCKVLYFLYFGSQASYLPFVPIIMSESGASQVEIGLILAVRPFIGFFSMPAIGLVADRLGQHKTIVLILIAFSSIMRLGLLGYSSLAAVASLVIISDFFANPISSIIDSTVLDTLPDPLHYGKQRLWGTIGWGGCAPLAGLIITNAGNSAALWLQALGSVLLVLVVSLFRVHTPPTEGGIWSAWQVIFKDINTFCFFLGTILMGQAYGAIDAFLFVRLAEIGGSALLMGMTLFVNCLVEAPVFHVSEPIIRRLGLIGVLQLCLLLMSVRLAFYGLMESPWWVLCVEGIHGVTFALLWTAGTTHWRRIGPEGMGATMQGFYTGIKYGVGSGSGSLIAGGLAHAYGLSRMFLYMAAVMATGSAALVVLQLVRWTRDASLPAGSCLPRCGADGKAGSGLAARGEPLYSRFDPEGDVSPAAQDEKDTSAHGAGPEHSPAAAAQSRCGGGGVDSEFPRVACHDGGS